MATIEDLDKKAKKAIANKKYYEANKEKFFDHVKKWREAHKDDEHLKECIRASSRKYYSNEENRERKKAKMREYQQRRKLERLNNA